MKINTKKRSKKPLLIAAIIAVVLLGGYTAYAATQSTWPFMKTETKSHHDDTTKSNDDSDKSDASKNSSSNDSDNGDATTPPSKTPPQYDEDPSKSTPKDTLTGVINYKAVNDGSLVLRTTINQDVSSGTCALTLANTATNKTFEQSVDIIQRPSASNCNGFTIPLSKLGNGTWNITIGLTSGNKSGTLSGEVTISE